MQQVNRCSAAHVTIFLLKEPLKPVNKAYFKQAETLPDV